MRHSTFGRRTGLRVSELALGTGNFGRRWGDHFPGAEATVAEAIFERFAEAGGTFIDTSCSYQFGESEEILGGLLRGRRDKFVVASKFANGADPDPGVQGTGNGRKAMHVSVEDSLRRLGTDYIDLLWVHFPDTVTPVDEIVRALDDMVRAGKILHAGFSNFPAWRTSRAVTLAEVRGWTPLVGVQFEYSLAERTAERDVIPMAEALGLGGALYAPLAGGLLTGKYRDGAKGRLNTAGAPGRGEDSAGRTAVLDALLVVAGEAGLQPAELAVAWLRERARRSATTMVPVIGPRSVAQLESYLKSLEVRLDDAQYGRLEKASAVVGGQPHDVIALHRPNVLGGPGFPFDDPIVPVP